MNRDALWAAALAPREPWDLIIVGGGATGAGVALDAAARGYRALLLERGDFGRGTSTRSTKLIHGGVRYLRQGSVLLVTESLRERGLLARNAPHLVRRRAFVVPTYSRTESLYYGTGLTLYGLLAGRRAFGRTRRLGRGDTLRRLPNLNPTGLHGGIVYHDGQFDDARLLVHLLATAVEHGAVVLNYVEVVGLTVGGGRVDGVLARDAETGREHRFTARVVVNAAGPFCDDVRRLAEPAAAAIIAPSRGSHLVLPGSFLGGDAALMIPRTPDGRVLFVVPWLGRALVGTTDAAVEQAESEPRADDAEVDFLLQTAGRYLRRPPRRADVLCVFAGIRPLLRAAPGVSTAALSREHAVRIEPSGLVTIAGGKWTTYRNMAEDCVDRAAVFAGLPRRRCRTRTLALHGWSQPAAGSIDEADRWANYGADAPAVAALQRDPALARPLHPSLPYTGADIVWAARNEMARTVEDVLARRTRALFLDAGAAAAIAEPTADLLARELGRDRAWRDAQVAAFQTLAEGYRLRG